MSFHVNNKVMQLKYVIITLYHLSLQTIFKWRNSDPYKDICFSVLPTKRIYFHFGFSFLVFSVFQGSNVIFYRKSF